jgi:tyrosinase
MVADTVRPGERYARVRQILDEAAGGAEPGYDGQGRFWARGVADLEAATVYGIAMIAPAGTPRRGARSGLVIGLRGQPPFDGGQFPPLPWGGSRVSGPNIQLISDWIDDGLPEVDRPDDIVVPPLPTDDPNAHRESIGAIKARHDVEYLSDTELANLRAAVAELKKLDAKPRDRRGYAAWAQIHGDECPHGWSVFLPWHRMYLWGFEQQLQDYYPSVTLPYWDWSQSTPDMIADGYIPTAYRCGVTEGVLRALAGTVPAVAVKALEALEGQTYYTADRLWAAAGSGVAEADRSTILAALEADNPLFTDQRWPGQFGTDSLSKTLHHHYPTPTDIERILDIDTWRDFGGGMDVDQSFGILDMDPHNTMHIWIGGAPQGLSGPQGYMLANLTAALDPIFWAHHANIDRIWALWQERHPGVDPPDPGDVLAGVSATVGDSLSISKLGYEYAADTHLLAASNSGQGGDRIATPPAGAMPIVLSSHRRAEVRLHRVRQPKRSFLVRVFLNAPDADVTTPLEGNEHYAGHFSLFGHGPCVGGPGHCDPRPRVRPFDTRPQHHNEPWNVRFDVTETVAALVAKGATDIEVTLVVVSPGGEGDPHCKLELDGVSLSFHH